jgi:hypothetical protein
MKICTYNFLKVLTLKKWFLLLRKNPIIEEKKKVVCETIWESQ